MSTSRNTSPLLILLTVFSLHLMALPASGERRDTREQGFAGHGAEPLTDADGERRPHRRPEHFRPAREGDGEKIRDAHRQDRRRDTSEAGQHRKQRDTENGRDRSRRAARTEADHAGHREVWSERIERQARHDDDRRQRSREQNFRIHLTYGPDKEPANRHYDHYRPWDRSYDRDQRRHKPHYSKSDRQRGPRHVVRHVVHHLPPRHTVIRHGRDSFHYHAGRYYRPHASGFILVRPPLGMIVFNLPIGSRTVITAGVTHHVFGDVYYRRVAGGYQVVEPVRRDHARLPTYVSVVTDLLNVRYAPDDHEQIIAQVERYTVLEIIGSAPGWLYVEIPDEDVRGWIREEYVAANIARG